MHEASLTLPAELESVSRARHFLRDALSRWQADGYDLAAPQVLTELAANAALHARTTYTVHVRLEREVLLLEVSDSSATMPQQRHYGTAATTGRGIALVDALSQAWGVRLRAAGKTVWCRVGRDDRLPDFFDVDDDDLTVEGHAARRRPELGGLSGTVMACAA